MQNKKVATISEFITAVEDLVPRSAHGELAAFRGQSDATLNLLPGIVRPPFDPARSLFINPDDAVDKSAERRLLLVFRDHAYPHLPQWVWLGSEVEIKWKQIIVAQHYRMPTRLLDWSANPLVALFFAVEGAPQKCLHKKSCAYRTKGGNHHAAVFVLIKRDTFSAASLAQHNSQPPLYGGKHDPGLIRPPDIDRRIAAQGSLFSISSDPRAPIQPDATILVDDTQRELLLRQLDTLGISRRTLFPDLDGISEYLKWGARFWRPDPGYLP